MRRLLLCAAAMLLLGIAAGLVWLGLADPAQWEARAGGIVLTEAASKGQFSVIVTFVLVGAVASLLGGIGTTLLLGDDLDWPITPVTVVLALAAGLVAWRVGVELGPPDPSSVMGVAIGDRIPASLEVDSIAPFLVWPIFALVGVVVTTWARRLDRERAGV